MKATDVIEESIRILLGGSREEMNKLASSVSSGATSLTFTYSLGSIREGAQVCIDNEVFRVWSVDESTKTATVEPGVLGSTTASHSSNALVYVNPRFPRFAVLKSINDELNSLSSPSNGLYRMKQTEFDFNAVVSDYELPTDCIDVYDAFTDTPGPSQAWVRIPSWSWNPNANTTDFTTGKSIRIPTAYQGRTVRVLYKASFSSVVDASADLATETGLPTEAHDILSLGVLMRLGPTREIKRNFTEAQRGDNRRAEEVPAGAVTNSFSWVRNQRATRITEERTRLERLYPPRHGAR